MAITITTGGYFTLRGMQSTPRNRSKYKILGNNDPLVAHGGSMGIITDRDVLPEPERSWVAATPFTLLFVFGLLSFG
jgi:hypothetical protein